MFSKVDAAHILMALVVALLAFTLLTAPPAPAGNLAPDAGAADAPADWLVFLEYLFYRVSDSPWSAWVELVLP